MKRIGNMMYVEKPKKAGKCNCTTCGKSLSPEMAYYYVDGCNCAITNNAPPYCKECYIEKYGKR